MSLEENKAPPGNLAPTTTAKKNGRTRAPLGELNMNIVQVGDLLKPFASPSKKNDMGRGHLNVASVVEQPDSPAAVAPKQSVPVAANLFVHEDELEVPSPVSEEAQKHEDADSASSSGSEIGEEVDQENLPSLGSASHGTGECKRCNFFAKGRCQNGKDCSFCHFTHETRKPSRQEKRERREKRLTQDGDSNNDEPIGDAAPTRSRKAPAPLDMVGQAALAPPPGLVAWEPEVEVSPFSFFPMGQTMPGLSPYQQFVSSTPMSSSLLSTVPSSAPTAQSTPYPTPLSTPTGGSEPHRMLPGGLGTTTSGTQTGTYMCRKCETVASPSSPTASGPDSDAHKWPRDELLCLRSSLMKVPAFGEKRTLPIRTETNTALGAC